MIKRDLIQVLVHVGVLRPVRGRRWLACVINLCRWLLLLAHHRLLVHRRLLLPVTVIRGHLGLDDSRGGVGPTPLLFPFRVLVRSVSISQSV